MSERNIERTSGSIEALNKRDVQAFIAYCHPSLELHSLFSTTVGGTVYKGHDGIRRWFREIEDVWGEDLRIEPDAYFDLGERTLVFAVLRGRGRHSGVDVAMPYAVVVRWREDLAVHTKMYTDREDALRDLGVSEDELEPIAP